MEVFVRSAVLAAVLAGVAAGQPSTTSSTTYTTDLNGRRVEATRTTDAKYDGTSVRAEWTRDVNGRPVALEKVEEKVLRDDSTGKLVERIVRRYDQNGNPGPIEKVVSEERKNADGSVAGSVTTVYRGDLNGRLALSERAVTEISRAGDAQNAVTTVERAGFGSSLEVVEKKNAVTVTSGNATREEVTTLRKDVSGRFTEALRQVTDATVQNGQRVENTVLYTPGVTGKFEVAAQTVTRSTQNDDGTVSKEVDIYRNVPGHVSSGRPRLRERQVVEQRKSGADVIESTVVMRPTISDPDRLGEPRKIAERVCSGGPCK